MSTLKLSKNFGNLLVDDSFLPNHEKTLLLRIQSKKGHLVKKSYKESEKVNITDIKSVETATFGTNNEKKDVLNKINYYISLEEKTNQFVKLNKLFISFCKTYLKVLCPRCYIKQNSVSGLNPHNSGFINLLLLNCPPESYNKLFDGLIKCFIAFLINEDQNLIPEKKGRWIETFAYIVTNIYDANENNKHIKYSNCIHDFYTGKHNEMEYMAKYKNIEQKMKPSTMNAVKTFYAYIYPALRYFNDNKNDIFIRHGLEKDTDNYNENMVFPPNNSDSGWRIHKVTNAQNQHVATRLPAYPIEFDKLPLNVCSRHSANEIYGNVKGFIARSIFGKFGGKIHIRYDKNENTMAREHLFAESAISVKSWVFTYRDNYKDSLKNEVKGAIRSIIVNKLPLIADNGLELFMNILDTTMNKFIMLH